MLTFRLLAVGAAAVALVLPAAAQAGTVAQVNGVNTYSGSPGEETVALSNDAGKTVFQSSAIGLGGPGPCTPNGGDRIDCDTTATTAVNARGAATTASTPRC